MNGERYTLPDGRVYENRNDQLTLIHDPGKEEKLMDIEDIEPDNIPLRLDYSGAMELHKLAVAEGKGGAFQYMGRLSLLLTVSACF